jgi:ribose 5-phosphate isomerase A
MTPQQAASAKETAANYAVTKFVKTGMRLGLGSGSTAAFAVRALAKRIAEEQIALTSIVSTSTETAALARSLGIELSDNLTPAVCPIDVTIDGADEVDAQFNLIKGGGGALLREKLVAINTHQEVIIIDETKFDTLLGNIHPLPVMIVPYGWELTKVSVEKECGRCSVLRLTSSGSVFVSNDGLYCLDVATGTIADPSSLEQRINAITGVVDVGLFVGLAKNIVIGYSDGSVKEPLKG